MTIVGIGTDIVSIKRIAQTLSRKMEHFCRKVFRSEEREAFNLELRDASFARINEYIAARFAAKEAIIKALSQKKLSFRKIFLTRDIDGGISARIVDRIDVDIKRYKIFISISHERDFAIAFVIVEEVK